MLMRFDPIGGLDRIAEELTTNARRGPRPFAMDAFRHGDEVMLLFDLPGVDAQSIDLTVDQHVLTIRAERQPSVREGDEIISSERPMGTFVRRVFLGDALDTDRINADYRNGVLQLTIPVSERAKPRRIEIAAEGGGPQTIEQQPQQSAERQPATVGA
jgi:HSP20 family protein